MTFESNTFARFVFCDLRSVPSDDKVAQKISHEPHKCDASLHAHFDYAFLEIFDCEMSCCTCCTYAKYHGRASTF